MQIAIYFGYNLIYDKFTNHYLKKIINLTQEDIEIKALQYDYDNSFEKLKLQMRKELKEEEEKVKIYLFPIQQSFFTFNFLDIGDILR
jgi:major membrane immunogen (membrane-anchored lipoprotein)